MNDEQARTEEPVYIVAGDLVALGPLRPEQVDLWLRWLNDVEVTRTLNTRSPVTREAEQRFYDQAVVASDSVNFAIYDRARGVAIGTTGLREINHAQGTATFGIFIGDKTCWNRGFGTEATRLTLDYAFHLLGLHNVLLAVFSTNPRGQRAYEKAGFREIGRRRQAFKLGQRRYDEILMDALASEFVSPVLETALHAPLAPKTPQA